MKDGKPDMSKMSLAEQLAWQRAENDRKSKEKEAEKKTEESAKPKLKEPIMKNGKLDFAGMSL